MFSRLPARDRRLIIETVVALGLARVAVVTLSLRDIGRLVSRPVRRAEPGPPARAEAIRRIRWAIAACASRVPWRALCFEQGLAAQSLLRRRGIPAVLYVGAARDDGNGFASHAWVRHGDMDVVGGEISARFDVLTSFPLRPL